MGRLLGDRADVRPGQLGQRIDRPCRARVVALRAQDLEDRRTQERVVYLGCGGRFVSRGLRLGLR